MTLMAESEEELKRLLMKVKEKNESKTGKKNVYLEPIKIKSVTFSIVSPSVCHEVMGPDAIILVLKVEF